MPASDYVLSLREKIGNDWIMLPGASAMIFNDEGYILLHQRTDNGIWSLVGGGSDPGEHPAETAVREAYEEVGVRVVPERIVGVYGGTDHLVTYPNDNKVAYTITAFKCRIIEGVPHVADDESLDVRFFPIDAIPDSLPPRHKLRVQHVFNETKPYFAVPEQMPTPTDASYMKTLRTVTGHAQIMLLGSTAVIRDEQGRVLVQQRVDSGMWNLPGGCMEIGEDPATTAIREAFEETGLQVQATRLVGVYGGEEYFVTYPNGDEVAYTNYTFECRIIGGKLSAANSESAALRFVTPDTLPQPFDSNHIELIDHTFNRSTPYFKVPR